MLREPDFIIGGATLGGTRALINILNAHHQVKIPEMRDARYFESGKPIIRSRRPLHEIFEDAANIRFNNQIPPTRTLYGEEEYDPLRAAQGAPYAKVVFTLRNPIIRCFMQFHNAKALGKEKAKTFEHAIDEELSGIRNPQNSNRCWIYKNQYQKHLDLWLSVYAKPKMKVIICEEWTAGLHQGLVTLENFLGLEQGTLNIENAYGDNGVDALKFHEKILPKVIDYPPLSEKTQSQLEDLFAIDVNFVENFLGRKILSWS